MGSEEAVQQVVRLHAAHYGMYWRNNVGACVDQTGRMVRYGLANDSAKLNAFIKSSDLIGLTPVRVTGGMVGRVVGVFTALECKRSEWRLMPNDMHSAAQQRFIDIVRENGGLAGFVQSTGDYDRIVGR